ncbi:kelch-like protein 26 [Branchiostoma lanceolatum]|uniref:kelch-like protein 26 n=1 Tax=Branchiostoma lanceolatum TaxID=7740 RepID=UPI003455ECD0
MAASCESVKVQYQRLQKGGALPCGNILPKVLSIFLGYVYSGTILVHAELVSALVSVADEFGCKSLKNLCMQLLKRITSCREWTTLSGKDWTFSVIKRQEMYILQRLQDELVEKKASGKEACKTAVSVPANGQLGLDAVPGVTDRRIYIRNEYHTEDVVRRLQEIQSDTSMCDVMLEADGVSLSAHRAVLATCSDYFRAMFTVGMRECAESHVVLRDISATGLGVVVSYMYTGEVHLSQNTVEIVLEVAHILLVSNVIDLCSDYLIQTMSTENCLAALQLAYRYSLSHVETAADNFILANIPQVSKSPGFKDLTCEELCLYLESDRLEVTSEVDAFCAAAAWINHDLDSRVTLAGRVMRNIRFPLMSLSDLVRDVRAISFMKTDEECRNLVMEATKYHRYPDAQFTMQSSRTQVRSVKGMLVVLGGNVMDQGASREMFYLEESSAETPWEEDAILPWQQVQDLPFAGKLNHAVAVVDNFLYLAGGYDKKMRLHGTFCRYDPRSDTWTDLRSMRHARSDFCLVVVDRVLYAVGGWNGEEIDFTVEKYSIKKNVWKYTATLDCGVTGHACCIHDNKIYLSGGRTVARGRSGFWLYEPETGVTSLNSLKHGRANHAMAEVKEGFIVLGGDDGSNTVPQVEVYSFEGESWSVVTTWPRVQCRFGHHVLDRTLYMCGGYDYLTSRYADMVQALELDRYELWDWRIVGRLPYMCDGIAASSLLFPEQFKRENSLMAKKLMELKK